MQEQKKALRRHRHAWSRLQVVEQRGGVPYLTGRTVCSRCGAVHGEQPRRLAAA
jgi:hypothetical protein